MKIKSGLADFFCGALALIVSLAVIDKSDNLLYFSLVATSLLFLLSLYRGSKSQLTPWISNLLINFAFIGLIVFQFLETELIILLAALPSFTSETVWMPERHGDHLHTTCRCPEVGDARRGQVFSKLGAQISG